LVTITPLGSTTRPEPRNVRGRSGSLPPDVAAFIAAVASVPEMTEVMLTTVGSRPRISLA